MGFVLHVFEVTPSTLCLIPGEGPQEDLVARLLSDLVGMVVSITDPERAQRYGDTVRLLEPACALVDDGDPPVLRRYARSEVVRAGGYRTDRLTVPHPGHRELLRLERVLGERGWGLGIGGIFDTWPEACGGRARPTLELWLATPATASAIEIDAVLGACTTHWVHPPAYGEVVARSGGNEGLHRARTEAYAGGRC